MPQRREVPEVVTDAHQYVERLKALKLDRRSSDQEKQASAQRFRHGLVELHASLDPDTQQKERLLVGTATVIADRLTGSPYRRVVISNDIVAPLTPRVIGSTESVFPFEVHGELPWVDEAINRLGSPQVAITYPAEVGGHQIVGISWSYGEGKRAVPYSRPSINGRTFFAPDMIDPRVDLSIESADRLQVRSGIILAMLAVDQAIAKMTAQLAEEPSVA